MFLSMGAENISRSEHQCFANALVFTYVSRMLTPDRRSGGPLPCGEEEAFRPIQLSSSMGTAAGAVSYRRAREKQFWPESIVQ